MSHVSVLAGLVTRTWAATTPEGVKQITLTHHTVTGEGVVVDDSGVWATNGGGECVPCWFFGVNRRLSCFTGVCSGLQGHVS
jgi:hypothetical protein